ncbi:MAG: hypothetical protein DMG38_25080 [Acidobacteria bacterium]|nr:MAG: hypothetical protein DMG38_25080 [Acidobacteriota bacterium]
MRKFPTGKIAPTGSFSGTTESRSKTSPEGEIVRALSFFVYAALTRIIRADQSTCDHLQLLRLTKTASISVQEKGESA